ncbi:MAG: IS4 family transposase, partial [Pseudanabaena sp.]
RYKMGSIVRELEPNLFLYDVVVWSLSLKRKIRLAFLLDSRNPECIGRVLLFSNDIHLDASDIFNFYKARF